MSFPSLSLLSAAIRISGLTGVPSPTDMIAHWTMDTVDMDGNNTAYDIINNYDLTVAGGVSNIDPGFLGEAVHFNGNSSMSYTDASGVFKNASFTYSTWVRSSDTSTTQLMGMFDASSTKAGTRLLIDSSGYARIGIADALGGDWNVNIKYAIGTTVINNGVWHHVVGTYDGTNLAIYVDGLLETSNVPTISLAYPSGTDGFDLGAYIWVVATNNPLEGDLDDAKVFDRAISADEVEAMFVADGGVL